MKSLDGTITTINPARLCLGSRKEGHAASRIRSHAVRPEESSRRKPATHNTPASPAITVDFDLVSRRR
jgi:hypothetical protein